MGEQEESAGRSIPAKNTKVTTEEPAAEPAVCSNVIFAAERRDLVATRGHEHGSLSTPVANTISPSGISPLSDANIDSTPNWWKDYKETDDLNSVDHGGIYLQIPGFSAWPSILPLRFCHTWDHFQRRIQLLLSDKESALTAMIEQRFVLSTGYDNAIIQPEEWHLLVKPDMRVVLSIQGLDEFYKSRTEESEASDTETESIARSGLMKGAKAEDVEDVKGRKGLQYSIANRYTTEFYDVLEVGLGPGRFLHKTITDNPLPWKRTAFRDIPVLEEIRRVTRDSGRTERDDSRLLPMDPMMRQKSQQKEVTDYQTLLETDQTTKIQLRIHSQPLLNALRAVVSYASDDRSGESLEDGLFSYPYKLLYHNKNRLRAYAEPGNPQHSAERNEQTGQHVEHLIKFLYIQPGVGLEEVEKNWNNAVPIVAFKDLWLLFRPGEDMYVKEHGNLNAYVLDSVTGPLPSESGKDYGVRSYTLQLWNLDFDGKSLGRSFKTVKIGYFQGSREISTLAVYPQLFQNDGSGDSGRRSVLVQRGQHFVKLCKQPTLQEYSGRGVFHGVKQYTKQRVMADHTARPWELPELEKQKHRIHIPRLFSHNVVEPQLITESNDESSYLPPPFPRRPSRSVAARALPRGCRCDECLSTSLSDFKATDFYIIFAEYDGIDPLQHKALTSHQYMLCSQWFYAFVLKDRKWDLLEVSGLQDPHVNRNSIDSLVMAVETKDVIRAICKTYLQRMAGRQFFTADFIKGKGEGQIFLLHGPPGTGKTLTAECVAEYTGRPLLSITAGDLGSDPVILEEKLLRYFRNGNDWDAVILLDEADIFLHERGDDDLKRNSIVSVFLRAMDYFEGILFLTTNRVGVIDEAFKSRIHMQLGFDELNDAARNKIWEMNFERLRRSEIKLDYAYSAKEYVEQSKEAKDLKLNGREIRNAFQTAVALAVDEDFRNEAGQTVLSEKHLSTVLRMSRNFREYMKKTNKADDATLAHARGLRYDRPRNAEW